MYTIYCKRTFDIKNSLIILLSFDPKQIKTGHPFGTRDPRPQERSFNVLHSLCAVSSAWTFQLASSGFDFYHEENSGNVTEVPSLELTYSL